MKNRERDRLSKSSTETPRRKKEADHIDVKKKVDRRSRRVPRNKKGSSEIESSEESTKSEEGRSRNRIRERTLRRARTKETVEEVIETEEIFSPTSKNVSRPSTNTSRKERERSTRAKGKDRNTEVPIAEMLKKALDKEHHDYYDDAVHFSTLTTDKVYVQGKNGFSAVRIPIASENDRGYAPKRLSKDVELLRDSTVPARGTSVPITIAIVAQKCWKRTALVYQGLLAGMALVHLTMVRLPLANLRKEEKTYIIQIFFDTSTEFISRYSLFSEIYRSLFSLMIALSVISIFDKFDIAHLKLDRWNDIRGDYVGSVITIPLYVATLCLHESFANVDDRLALIHYSDVNCSLRSNDTTNLEDFLDGLATWQKINISKDLLAALSWFLVAIGTQDDTLLMHLESMQEYKSDGGTPRTE